MAESRWPMWAGLRQRSDGAPVFLDVAEDRRHALMCGHEDPVPVEVAEDPDGRYLGWLRSGEEVPCMIQPHYAVFEVQFPYGHETAAARGDGRVLHLSITRREMDTTEVDRR